MQHVGLAALLFLAALALTNATWVARNHFVMEDIVKFSDKFGPRPFPDTGVRQPAAEPSPPRSLFAAIVADSRRGIDADSKRGTDAEPAVEASEPQISMRREPTFRKR